MIGRFNATGGLRWWRVGCLHLAWRPPRPAWDASAYGWGFGSSRRLF